MRCAWPGTDPLYCAYHDEEWGVPEWDDERLFEKLILDGFQAGLSWITILRKRDAFRKAFEGFDPRRVARFTPKKTAALMADEGIVRNRAKIEGAVKSARGYLEMVGRDGDFARFLWGFVEGSPLVNKWAGKGQLPTESPQSQAMSKALRERGFSFVGPTICYAFMQAVGMVNDHVTTCFRYPQLAESARRRVT
ncbi:MAG: DNA-3-methyladenine glycosylase I [Myxococcaceae bacterium]